MKACMHNMGKKLFHFLGSIPFALMLIAAAAAIALVGTILESKTDSHAFACYYTYENIIFIALLYGFFLNILISALRRFPFKLKHIPFLITHCGLLMVIAGQLVKKQYGTQGVLSIVEGGASDEILMPHSYALAVESKHSSQGKNNIHYFAFQPQFTRYSQLKSTSSGTPQHLKITLLNYAPNIKETLESWVKGQHFSILGVEPLKIEQAPISTEVKSTAFKVQAQLPGTKAIRWNLKGLETDAIGAFAKQFYSDHISVHLKESASERIITTVSLRQLLQEGTNTPFGTATGELQLEFTPQASITRAELSIQLKAESHTSVIRIPLYGPEALLNIYPQDFLGKAPITFDLSAEATLLLLQNPSKELLFFGWTPSGEIITKSLSDGLESTLMAFDEGFSGYSRELKFTFHASRQQRELERLEALQHQLKAAHGQNLSPPLQLLRAASINCGVDFPTTACDFLSTWNAHGGWLHAAKAPVSENTLQALAAINWDAVPPAIYQGCSWTVHLFDRLEALLEKGENIWTILEAKGYPLSLFSNGEHDMDAKTIFQKLTQHMFGMSGALKDVSDGRMQDSKGLQHNLRLLSAYFRAYEMHLSEIPYKEALPSEHVTLETSIVPHHLSLPREKKLENETPAVLLRVEDGHERELISLSYDTHASRLKWPVLGGKYLLRFQPMVQKIPHHLRLREARQITYADSPQPYSYESDLLIRENKARKEIEKTISMNVVHETKDGYRLYLANISKTSEGALKRVQIIVNQDPAKYTLTYFGGAITVLGILLLFWLQPYRKR